MNFSENRRTFAPLEDHTSSSTVKSGAIRLSPLRESVVTECGPTKRINTKSSHVCATRGAIWTKMNTKFVNPNTLDPVETINLNTLMNESQPPVSVNLDRRCNRLRSFNDRIIAPCKYTYKHFPGNNGMIILSNLKIRPWWTSCVNRQRSKSKKDKRALRVKWDSSIKLDESSLYDRPTTAKTANFVWEMSKNPKRYEENHYVNVVLNHLKNNKWLVCKKNLYFAIRDYCKKTGIDSSLIIPRTFFLIPGKGNESMFKEEADEKDLFLECNQLFMSNMKTPPDKSGSSTEGRLDCKACRNDISWIWYQNCSGSSGSS